MAQNGTRKRQLLPHCSEFSNQIVQCLKALANVEEAGYRRIWLPASDDRATPHISRRRCSGRIGRRTLSAVWPCRQANIQTLRFFKASGMSRQLRIISSPPTGCCSVHLFVYLAQVLHLLLMQEHTCFVIKKRSKIQEDSWRFIFLLLSVVSELSLACVPLRRPTGLAVRSV
jgi:hypothetical protein